jgi:pilus assembly protein CpaB
LNRTPLILALATGALGAGLLLFYKQRFESQVTGGAPVPVLIAVKEVPAGTALSDELLGVRFLPEAYVEPRHVRADQKDSVLGVRAGTQLNPNETVRWTDLTSGDTHSRKLAGLVRPGMRAVSVSVQGVPRSGLLRPGDRIDVLFTRKPASGERATAPFLQNLLVLAVGANVGGDSAPSSEAAGEYSVLTLNVTPDEAQRLTIAEMEGTLSVVLRNPNDVRVLENAQETRVTDVLKTWRSSGSAPAMPAVATSKAAGRRRPR